MGDWIENGKFANNFFHGEVISGGPKDEKEEVAGCLLDKVGAIVEENGVAEFVNDLQVDLAACCTKDDKDTCVRELGRAYSMFADVSAKKADSNTVAPKVTAMVL